MDFHGVFAALDEVWFVTGQGDGRPSKVIAGRILRAGSVEQQALVATMPQALGLQVCAFRSWTQSGMAAVPQTTSTIQMLLR